MALGAGTAAAGGASRAAAQSSGSKVLVVYFTRTGNTRVIAQLIRRALRADIFEIEPAAPYPEDYETTVSQAQRERDSSYQPPLAAAVPDIGAYEVVFLGFPIWGETIPPVIRSFLAQHDLTGKDDRAVHHPWRLRPGAKHEHRKAARTACAHPRSFRHGGGSGEADDDASFQLAEQSEYPRVMHRGRSFAFHSRGDTNEADLSRTIERSAAVGGVDGIGRRDGE